MQLSLFKNEIEISLFKIQISILFKMQIFLPCNRDISNLNTDIYNLNADIFIEKHIPLLNL